MDPRDQTFDSDQSAETPAPGVNPAVGTPHVAEPPTPPPVIHRAGEGHPGEANPAAALTGARGEPTVSTAEFLAAREAAEEALSRTAGPPYADTTADPG